MSLMDIIKEAQAAWNWLHGREANAPVGEEDIKGIVELASATATILTKEQYKESARQVAEAYKKSVEPPPPMAMFKPLDNEQIRKERLRQATERIEQLEGLANDAEGRICPFTLIGEYPRRCLEGKCVWYDSGWNQCLQHTFINGGRITVRQEE